MLKKLVNANKNGLIPSLGHQHNEIYGRSQKIIRNEGLLMLNKKWVQDNKKFRLKKCEDNSFSIRNMLEKGNLNCAKCPENIPKIPKDNQTMILAMKVGCDFNCRNPSFACKNYSKCCANNNYRKPGRKKVCKSVSKFAKEGSCSSVIDK